MTQHTAAQVCVCVCTRTCACRCVTSHSVDHPTEDVDVTIRSYSKKKRKIRNHLDYFQGKRLTKNATYTEAVWWKLRCATRFPSFSINLFRSVFPLRVLRQTLSLHSHYLLSKQFRVVFTVTCAEIIKPLTNACFLLIFYSCC